MFRRLLPLLLLIVSVMVDISVVPMLPGLAWQRYIPLFSLMTVVVLGLLLGRTRGSLYGLIGGLLVDILVGSPLGLMAAVFIVSGYLSGFAGRRYQRFVLTPVLMPLLCFALYELTMTGYRYLASGMMEVAILWDGLIRVPVATVCAQLMYLLYDRILKPSWSRYAGL